MSEWEFLQIKDLVSDGSLEKPLDGNHGGIHPKGADFVLRDPLIISPKRNHV